MEELKVWIFIKRDHKSGSGWKGSFEDIKVGASEASNCQTVVYYLGNASLVNKDIHGPYLFPTWKRLRKTIHSFIQQRCAEGLLRVTCCDTYM